MTLREELPAREREQTESSRVQGTGATLLRSAATLQKVVAVEGIGMESRVGSIDG